MTRHLPLVIGALSVGLIAPPSSAAQEPPDDAPPELLDRAAAAEEAGRVAGDLSDAVRTLEDIEAAIESAERAVAAAEERLREASEAVERLEQDIEVAQEAVATAERDASGAARRLAAAGARLDRASAVQADASAQLRDRSVEVFKYGAGEHQRAVVTGIVGAGDLHEVVFATRAVSRIVRSDRDLLREAELARADADLAREEAAEARRDADASAQRAHAERGTLTELLEKKAAALAVVERERAEHQAVLDELREDSALTELLVRRLAEELARLAQIAATPLPPPEPEIERAGDEDSVSPVEDTPRAEGEPPPWADRLPAAGRPWAARIDAAAAANWLDGRLLAALVWTESGFNPTAVSWAGAIGLTQLMPATAASLGVNPWDPDQNLDGGARYLARQLARFGTLDLALAAYNAGPNAVRAAGPGIPQNVQTPLFVVRVLERYNHIAG